MDICVSKSKIAGEIAVPSSKSHTIRAVAIASMAEGKSAIINPLVSGDTLSSLNAAESFGAEIERKNDFWKIKGIGGKFRACSKKTVYLGNSGTSLRIFTGLASLADNVFSFDGDKSLRTREMRPLLSSIEELGAEIKSANGKCPLSVRGPLKGGRTKIEGKSSQFVTSLLLATPLIKADSQIEVFKLNEKPYLEITLDWLKKQNIEIEYADDFSNFKIKGHQAYKAFESLIPADFSTATFPLVAAAITKGEVKIKNLDFNDRQGDKDVFKIMEKMGMEIKRDREWTSVKAPSKLNPISVDLNSTPDALPALAVAACFAEGKTELLNVPQARIKETDRIACMTCELRKMGAKVEELEDGMIIHGTGYLDGTVVDGHDDHRIVMALAIAGLSSKGQTTVKGVEAASVTYPNFIRDFQKLGAKFCEVYTL
jgi:3-phosphoshikimate 1-carboxyvinyltransferase